MSKLKIQGPTKLVGEITVAGSKNAILPIMAACLLTEEPVTLRNVPALSDVALMADILRGFGAEVIEEEHVLKIHAKELRASDIPLEQTSKMRASILILGGAIGRLDRVNIAHPGGDLIGARPIDTHIKVFESLGLSVETDKAGILLSGKPRAGLVNLGELSVTATENAIMAAVLAEGTSCIRVAATEPHVVDLCNFLNHLGAKISGVGSNNLVVEGVANLRGGDYSVIADQLEAGTLAIAAAASQGHLIIHDFIAEHHDSLLAKFDEMNVNYQMTDAKTIVIKPSAKLVATKVKSQPYPNFPSDLQAPMSVLMTQAEGESEIFESLYEGRMNYIYELQRMGANVSLRDTHTALINGPSQLRGAELISFDIRAGATILIAALIAEGETTIDRIEHIERGYEHFADRLRSLGAKMEQID